MKALRRFKGLLEEVRPDIGPSQFGAALEDELHVLLEVLVVAIVVIYFIFRTWLEDFVVYPENVVDSVTCVDFSKEYLRLTISNIFATTEKFSSHMEYEVV